jgi:hypothetical protein
MKTSFVCACLSILSFTACATPPESKMTIKVIDEETFLPLTNCTVKTRYLVKENWNEPDEYDEMAAAPNSEGLCTFASIDCISDFGGGVVADGYYRASFFLPSTGLNRILNRWEPWDPTIEVKMRKIKNPVPMVTKWVSALKIPKWDEPIGFDFEKSAWVAPYGKGGCSDFFVTMYRRFNNSNDYEVRASISFPNKGDGIQFYTIPQEIQDSSYVFPYLAPESGYNKELILSRKCEGAKDETNFDPKKSQYVFRVRTKLDQEGKVISACYGRMDRRIEISWGEVIDFEYHFNLDSFSRSLEYNGVNLLKK